MAPIPLMRIVRLPLILSFAVNPAAASNPDTTNFSMATHLSASPKAAFEEEALAERLASVTRATDDRRLVSRLMSFLDRSWVQKAGGLLGSSVSHVAILGLAQDDPSLPRQRTFSSLRERWNYLSWIYDATRQDYRDLRKSPFRRIPRGQRAIHEGGIGYQRPIKLNGAWVYFARPDAFSSKTPIALVNMGGQVDLGKVILGKTELAFLGQHPNEVYWAPGNLIPALLQNGIAVAHVVPDITRMREFHSRSVWENSELLDDQVIAFLRHQFSKNPLALIGFSLGGDHHLCCLANGGKPQVVFVINPAIVFSRNAGHWLDNSQKWRARYWGQGYVEPLRADAPPESSFATELYRRLERVDVSKIPIFAIATSAPADHPLARMRVDPAEPGDYVVNLEHALGKNMGKAVYSTHISGLGHFDADADPTIHRFIIDTLKRLRWNTKPDDMSVEVKGRADRRLSGATPHDPLLWLVSNGGTSDQIAVRTPFERFIVSVVRKAVALRNAFLFKPKYDAPIRARQKQEHISA